MIAIADVNRKIRSIVGINSGIYSVSQGMITDDIKLKALSIDIQAFELGKFTTLEDYQGIKCHYNGEDVVIVLPGTLDEKSMSLLELLIDLLSPDDDSRLSKAIRGDLIDFNIRKRMESYLPCWIYGMYHEGDSKETVEYLRQFYPEEKSIIMSDNEIVVLSQKDIMSDDFKSIYDSAQTELYSKISIIQGDYVANWEHLIQGYSELNELFSAVKLINSGEGVFKKNEILAPWLLKKIERDKLSLITQGLKRTWTEELSDELLITAKAFFNNNLNITDTANKLYLHRNTLIYRLNKIEKITGYDIRKFHDGINFYLILLCDSVGRNGEDR